MHARSLGLVAATLLSWSCGKASRPHPPRHVVLITVDTLRADHLGVYGYDGARTPHIDELGERGVVFERAVTPVPVTLPAHASLLTGLYPPTHGVRDNTYFRLAKDATTLAELFRAEGFQTAAFVGAFVLDRRFGLGQGFDVYDDAIGEQSGDDPASFAERPAADVARACTEWLETRSPEQPFFAWLHFFDPHLPYRPPPPFDEPFARNPYDGEIAYVDSAIGTVLSSLERHGLLEDTLVVLTADHGESLGEHGEKSHGFFVYDATLRVPLILASPGALPEGARVPEPVSTVDVFPTIVETLGLTLPEGVQGRSLLARLEAGAAASRADGEGSLTYAECYVPQLNFGWAPLVTLRADGFKYIHAPHPELYDLTADPKELRNLYEEDRPRAEAMRKRLSALLSSWPASLSSRSQPDQETIERLRSLGYTGSGGAESSALGDVTRAADPKNRLHLWRRLEEVILNREAGDLDGVVAGTQAVLDEDPTNLLALELLAEARAKAGRIDEALGIYEEILALDDSKPLSHLLYGNLLWKAGKLDTAERAFEKAIEKDPGFARAHRRLGEIYLATGRGDAARLAFERSVAIDDTPEARLGLARSLEMMGDTGTALETLQRLYDEAPDEPAILSEYARALARRGKIDRGIDLLRKGPDDPDVHYTLSVLYRSKGDMAEALHEAERAVAQRPDYAAALNDLGVLLSRAGRLEEAIAALRKALESQPTPTTENALGTALCRLDRCDEGVLHFEAAVAQAPEFVEALENLAQAYAVLGRDAEAERVAARAERLRKRR